MNKKIKLERNINKNYIFHFLNSLNLTRGIWMLYLAYKGLSLFEIGLMETVFHVSSFLMEIPTGAVADIFGRKVSRTLGRLAGVIGTLLMLFGNGVIYFIIAFVFSALSYNLESGAGDALVYDSMKEIGKEDEFIKVAGRQEFLFNIASIISLVIAGYIATLSFETVYKFTLVLAVLTLVQSFSFKEPEIGKAEKKESFVKTFVNQLKNSFIVVKNDKRVAGVILAGELFAALYTTSFFYLQNRLDALGSTTFEIGIVLAAGSLACAVMATQTHKLEKKFSITGIIKLTAVIGILGFWVLSIESAARYAFVVLSAMEGMLFVAVSDYVNKLIPSKQRATILSLQSMMFSFYMIVLFPVFGKIGDLYGLGISFVFIAVIASISLGTILFVISRRKQLINKNTEG